MEQTNGSAQTKAPETKKKDKAALIDAAPTLAEHIATHTSVIDAQVDVLSEKKDAILATPAQGLSGSIAALQKNQASIIDTEIASLNEKKASLAAFLENIPTEFHALEARVFAVLKHIF